MLALTLALALALLLAEIGLRLVDIRPPRLLTKRLLESVDRTLPDYHCYPANPRGEFQPLPPDVTSGKWRLLDYMIPPSPVPWDALADTPWCVEYRFSSIKLRDREYPPKPPSGVTRIAMVGDSFVFGEGVPLERTLPRQLEAELGAGFEVVNLGRVGFDTAKELPILLQAVRQLGCTRAIVVFLVNDVELTDQLKLRQDRINDLIVVRDELLARRAADSWLAGPSRLLSLLSSRHALAEITRSTIAWYQDSFDRLQNADNLDRLGAHFRTMATLPDCRVALALFPLLEGLENYPLARAHAAVAAIAARAGLPVLDLADAFAGRDAASLWVDPADHHPCGAAHAIAARALADWLRALAGFLSPAPER